MRDYENDIIQLLNDYVNDHNCLNDNGEFIDPQVDQVFTDICDKLDQLFTLVEKV